MHVMPAAVPILNPRLKGGDAFSFRGGSGTRMGAGDMPFTGGTPGNWSGTPMSLGFGMGTSFKPESLKHIATGNSWKADNSMHGVAAGTSFIPGSFSGMGSSWKVGQHNSSMYFLSDVPGGPLMGPMDVSDFKHHLSSSIESEHGRLIRSLGGDEPAVLGGEEFCRNYTCCGIPLPDLHSLVEHFEEAHVVVIDPANPAPPFDQNGALAALSSNKNNANSNSGQANNNNHNHDHGVFPISPNTQPTTSAPGGFDPDSMELDGSPATAGPSRSTTPPRSVFPTAILQGHANKSGNTNGQTNKPTPLMPFRPTSMQSVQPNPNEAFNRYAGYSDFSSRMPGTVPPVPTASATDANGTAEDNVISPGMLFERGRKRSRDGTPGASRLTSPGPVAGITVSGNPHGTGSPERADGSRGWESAMSSQAPSPTASELADYDYFGQNIDNEGLQASTTLSRPSTSLMLSKPYKCPTPGCNKSYKQANGLKYHITHGQCSFVPMDPRLEGLEEEDYERITRPYDCRVGNCNRRYKNMNGLRYHYQHSGAHGAVGLALLASGQHHLQTGTNAGKGLGSLTNLTTLSNGRSNIDINGNKIPGPPKRKGEPGAPHNPRVDAQMAMGVLGMNLRPPYNVAPYGGGPPPASDHRTVDVQNFPMDV
ncbi:unnamed protein product [Rhizoctonia solani]|uniref:C2H2-type domain-containing protein n=1 Tax=Rhizoctonia solani TaxID=456999 RepID=A0A8H3CRT3_9AGAM|nr:unnamed protein product [Rhizoctonia solani]